jgi:hypothetical protein
MRTHPINDQVGQCKVNGISVGDHIQSVGERLKSPSCEGLGSPLASDHFRKFDAFFDRRLLGCGLT